MHNYSVHHFYLNGLRRNGEADRKVHRHYELYIMHYALILKGDNYGNIKVLRNTQSTRI